MLPGYSTYDLMVVGITRYPEVLPAPGQKSDSAVAEIGNEKRRSIPTAARGAGSLGAESAYLANEMYR